MNNSEKRPPTILIVEDLDWIRASMKKEVEHQGYNVLEARDDAEGQAAAERQAIVLILTEEEVPTFDALMDRRRENLVLGNAPVAIVNPDAEVGTRYGDAHLLSDYADIRKLLAGSSGF
jgi:DNA-binding response OmpR family regulator